MFLALALEVTLINSHLSFDQALYIHSFSLKKTSMFLFARSGIHASAFQNEYTTPDRKM